MFFLNFRPLAEFFSRSSQFPRSKKKCHMAPNLLRWYIPDGFLLLLQRCYVAYPLSHGGVGGRVCVEKPVCEPDSELPVVHLLNTSSSGISGKTELLMWLTPPRPSKKIKINKQTSNGAFVRFRFKVSIESKCRGSGDFSEMRIITDGRPEEFILILRVITSKWFCGGPLIRLLLQSGPQY